MKDMQDMKRTYRGSGRPKTPIRILHDLHRLHEKLFFKAFIPFMPIYRASALLLLLALTFPTAAQRWRGFTPPTMAYDGRFVLARLYYPRYPGWSYDWPDMEDNLHKILHAVTAI